MAEEKGIRLGQASRKLNVGHNTILEFLAKKGFVVENNPNAKLSPEQFAMLSKEYASSASEKIEASGLTIGAKHNENIAAEADAEISRKKAQEDDQIMIKNLGSNPGVKEKPKEEPRPEKVDRDAPKLEGIKVLGKIDLTPSKKSKPEAAAKEEVKPEPPKTKAEEKPEEVVP
jgi:translation initiation factor IF-2